MIGLFPEMDYEEATIDLRSGDVLVAFTDGVTEALNTTRRSSAKIACWTCFGAATSCRSTSSRPVCPQSCSAGPRERRSMTTSRSSSGKSVGPLACSQDGS